MLEEFFLSPAQHRIFMPSSASSGPVQLEPDVDSKGFLEAWSATEHRSQADEALLVQPLPPDDGAAVEHLDLPSQAVRPPSDPEHEDPVKVAADEPRPQVAPFIHYDSGASAESVRRLLVEANNTNLAIAPRSSVVLTQDSGGSSAQGMPDQTTIAPPTNSHLSPVFSPLVDTVTRHDSDDGERPLNTTGYPVIPPITFPAEIAAHAQRHQPIREVDGRHVVTLPRIGPVFLSPESPSGPPDEPVEANKRMVEAASLLSRADVRGRYTEDTDARPVTTLLIGAPKVPEQTRSNQPIPQTQLPDIADMANVPSTVSAVPHTSHSHSPAAPPAKAWAGNWPAPLSNTNAVDSVIPARTTEEKRRDLGPSAGIQDASSDDAPLFRRNIETPIISHRVTMDVPHSPNFDLTRQDSLMTASIGTSNQQRTTPSSASPPLPATPTKPVLTPEAENLAQPDGIFELAGSREAAPLGPSSVSPPAGTPQLLQRLADHAPNAVRQLVERINKTESGDVELTLSPEELGKVRITISGSDRLTIQLWADRPEVLDMLRRHADLLQRELREGGLGEAMLSFQQDTHRDGRAAPERLIQDRTTSPDVEISATTHLPPTGGKVSDASRLDIRY